MKKYLIALFLMSMVTFTGCDKEEGTPPFGIEGLVYRMDKEEIIEVLGEPDEEKGETLATYNGKDLEFLGYPCNFSVIMFEDERDIPELQFVSIYLFEKDNYDKEKFTGDADAIINDITEKLDAEFERRYKDDSLVWSTEKSIINLDYTSEAENGGVNLFFTSWV